MRAGKLDFVSWAAGSHEELEAGVGGEQTKGHSGMVVSCEWRPPGES